MKNQSGKNSVNINIGGSADGAKITAAQEVGKRTLFDLSNHGAEEGSESVTAAKPDAALVALFRALSTKFTLEELESVCWELGMQFEDLPAKTLSGKARQLIEKAEDLNVLATLQEIVQRERPDVFPPPSPKP
nr:unknown Function [uncultured bacterium]